MVNCYSKIPSTCKNQISQLLTCISFLSFLSLFCCTYLCNNSPYLFLFPHLLFLPLPALQFLSASSLSFPSCHSPAPPPVPLPCSPSCVSLMLILPCPSHFLLLCHSYAPPSLPSIVGLLPFLCSSSPSSPILLTLISLSSSSPVGSFLCFLPSGLQL